MQNHLYLFFCHQLHTFHYFQNFYSLTKQNCLKSYYTHTFPSTDSTQAPAFTHVPFHPRSVDIVPPALIGFTPAIGSPLALKGPPAVGAFIGTEVTSDGHQNLSMGTLEVEALAPGIHPLFARIVRVAILSADSGEKHQQGQSQQNMSRVHPEVKHCGTFQCFLSPQGSLRRAGQMFRVWIQGSKIPDTSRQLWSEIELASSHVP